MTTTTTSIPSAAPGSTAPDNSGEAQGPASRFSLHDLSMVIALVAIWGFFGTLNPAFVGRRIVEPGRRTFNHGGAVAGDVLIILPGHIDLSIGSGVGAGGLAAVLIFEHQWPAAAAMAVALLLGLVIWVAMGALSGPAPGVHHHASRALDLQGTALAGDPQRDHPGRRRRPGKSDVRPHDLVRAAIGRRDPDHGGFCRDCGRVAGGADGGGWRLGSRSSRPTWRLPSSLLSDRSCS